MKKSLNAWAVDAKTGFEDMFAQVKAAGFDGIELNVDAEGAHALTLSTTAEELSAIKLLSEKYDLPVVSISSSLHGGRMGSNNAEDRVFAKFIIQKQLECAKVLGATGILIVPGGVSNTISIDQAYKNCRETISECIPMIEEYKIFVAVENVWNMFFLSPYDMINFVDYFDCKYITAYYDVGNTVAFTWTEYWIELLAGRISHIHFKDFKRNEGPFGVFNTGGDFVELGEGSIDWGRVMAALNKIGFNGYVTAEVFGGEEAASYTQYYKDVSNALDNILSL
ncbi:MAG: sugar phosphate isomerase/epimerase [Oscillospiraceae bacterium]|nr:sugar phosphate isomerase/epimerase [Oscillospiraceae bacterium]